MEKHIPMRRCIACMQSKPKFDLIRVNPDESGKGRYVCKDQKCVDLAIKRKRLDPDFKL